MIDPANPVGPGGWPMCYILVDRVPIAVDAMTWGKWFHNFENRKVANTVINDHCYVSTIFVGLAMPSFGDDGAPPFLFETMVFGSPIDQDQMRYRTWAEAERGHEELVTETRKAIAQVDAIARAAKAKTTDGAY